MRLLLAAALLVGLAACAPTPAAETQDVDVLGTITQVSASGGGRTYILDVAGQGLLPLHVGEVPPPFGAIGVTVEVPADLDIPVDVAGQFAALDAYVGQTGESLRVVAFLAEHR